MRKVCLFTGFHSTVVNTFTDLASSVLKESHYSKDLLENFRVLSKIREDRKTFLLLNFCHLRYACVLVELSTYVRLTSKRLAMYTYNYKQSIDPILLFTT